MSSSHYLVDYYFYQQTGAPIMEVHGNGVLITNGDSSPSTTDHTDFGAGIVGTPVDKVYTIVNTGTARLTGVSVSVPSGFTLQAAPAASIGVDKTSTFTVRATATVSSVPSGNVVVSSSELASYTFAIRAEIWLLVDGLRTAVAAYSLRKERKDYAGQCLRLRRSTDNVESDFGFDANRNLDVAAIASFLGAANGFVRTWYDQSGNTRDVIQTTTANQLQLILSVLNGHPALRGDGSNDSLANTSFADFGDNYSVYAVAKYASAGAADATQGLFDVSNGTLNSGFAMYHEATARFNARGASGVSLANSALDLRDGVFRIHDGCNTGSQIQYRRNNGSAQIGSYTLPSPNTLNRLDIGKFGQLANYILNGDIAQLVLFGVTHDPTERGAIVADIDNYWDVP